MSFNSPSRHPTRRFYAYFTVVVEAQTASFQVRNIMVMGKSAVVR